MVIYVFDTVDDLFELSVNILIETVNRKGEFKAENVQIVSEFIFREIASFVYDNYAKFSGDDYCHTFKLSLKEIFAKIL